MLNITQSQRIELLFASMQDFLAAHPVSVFEAQQVIVPSHGVGVWLRYQLASYQGISARLNTDFFGTYQWSLYKKVLGNDIPKNAPFTRQVIQWKLFCHLLEVLKKPENSADDSFKDSLKDDLQDYLQEQQILEPLLTKLAQHPQQQRKLWHLCGLISQVFANYVLYRSDWLDCWGQNKHLDIDVQLRKKDASTPDWLVERYEQMEQWQQFLWRRLFAKQFNDYQAIRTRFWQVLASNKYKQKLLPSSLTIFTVLQLPPAEFNFTLQLSQYTDIQFLHYNPSQEYWADSVDPQWLKRFALKNPHAARLFDSRHPLLTSMGKQSRDIFAQLAELSGNDANLEGQWVDLFPSYFPNTLLGQLQHDILHLVQPQAHSFCLREQDQSVQIHGCHSPLRQLEVLREELITWFGADASRQPGDVVVFVPNLPDIAPLIANVFSSGSGFSLPVHVTGVVQPDAEQLWQAMLGYFTLLSGRFSIEDLMDWLALPDVQQCYDLSLEQVGRLGEMLADAGFRRGFDAAHLRATLAKEDSDTRFTLQFALNRLMLGMVMPVQALHGGILPYADVGRQDFELIATLARIVADLSIHRNALTQTNQPVNYWLTLLRTHFSEFFVHSNNTVGGNGVHMAFSELQRSTETAESGELNLPLQFVLDEIASILQEAPPGSIPTGKITFSRLGTLRPLPYKLVVMLNLDSGVFPARDRKNTFDLINEMQARRGDRSRQSDDEGAFLDGLLLAQQACWMFYNGFSTNDTQVRQPSGILQQLIEFLDKMLMPHCIQPIPNDVADVDIDVDVATVKVANAHAHQLANPVKATKSGLDLIIQQHSLQPFETSNFGADRPRSYADSWFSVASGLQQPATLKPWFNQTLPLNHQGVLMLAKVIRDLKQPAKHFLRQSRVSSLSSHDIASSFEPLTLTKLDEYQIRSLHQQQPDSLIQGQLQSILPVGHAASAYWQKSQIEAQRNQQRLAVYGTESPLDEQQVQVGDFTIQALMPKPIQSMDLQSTDAKSELPTSTDFWLSQHPVKSKGQRSVQYWLEHLAWQIKRQTTQADVEAYHDQQRPVSTHCGERIVVLSDITLIFAPVDAAQATHYLLQWLDVWQQAASKPWVLPPDLVLDKSFGLAFDQNTQKPEIKNISKLLEQWRDGKRFFGGFSLPASEQIDCMQHRDWQIILRGQDAVQLCQQFMQTQAAKLYGPILDHVREEK